MISPPVKVISLSALPKVEVVLLEDLSSRLSRWKSRDFVSELTTAIHRRQGAMSHAASSTSRPTFTNTCLTLEMMDLEIDSISTDFNSLLSALRPKSLESAEKGVVALLSAVEASDMADNRMALRVRQLRRSFPPCRSSAKRKLIDDYYKGFLHEGCYLPKAKRSLLSNLSTTLARLESSYSRASSKERKYVLIRSRLQLEGLTAVELAEARLRAQKMNKEGWAIPLEPTQYQPVTSSLKSPRLRRRLHEASMARGRQTAPLASKILSVRHKIARLLGFRDWATYKLSSSFAKSPGKVWSTLKSLVPATRSLALRDVAMARTLGWSSSSGTPLCALSYLPSEEDAFRGFSPVSVLEKGCFTAAKKLFGLSFEKVEGVKFYHPDVCLYRAVETSGSTLGFLTVDPWLRPGKEDGAWASDWATAPGTLPVSAIVMNSARSGCTFLEAKTVFHEFGHALHSLFSFKQFPSHWGLGMPSDFAEIPSQLAETWAEYPEIYRLFAPPSAPALATLTPPTPPSGAGLKQAALLVSAAADMLMHSAPSVKSSPTSIQSADTAAASLVDLPKEVSHPRYKAQYFEHIFSSGYDAGYYSYLWSESRAKSLAIWLRKTGGLSLRQGIKLRKGLLAPGGTVTASDLAARLAQI